MDVRNALDQISRIQTQLAATEHLRSLRAVPVALSGLLALLASTAQWLWLPAPLAEPPRYLGLWCGAAGLGFLFASLAVAARLLRSDSSLGIANARLAALQFAPSLVAGASVTAFVALRAPELLWLLPGLWQLLFGLGNLAAHRLLPAPALLIGVFYVGTGSIALWLGEQSLLPWVMGVPFALGQTALAAILWWHHERGTKETWL